MDMLTSKVLTDLCTGAAHAETFIICHKISSLQFEAINVGICISCLRSGILFPLINLVEFHQKHMRFESVTDVN